MTTKRIEELLRNGEGLAVEFKRCSGRIEHDVFESICAFLNRFGGDLLLGVEDDGTVCGIKGDVVALRNNMDFVPDPKNPIIAAFFREIGYADQLGSGVRNLFKYAKAYGGSLPRLTDGDVFRIEVSLKNLPVAPISMEVARKRDTEVARKQDTEVARKKDAKIVEKPRKTIENERKVARKRDTEVARKQDTEVARKRDVKIARRLKKVRQTLNRQGRADSIENAVAVFKCIAEDGGLSIPDIEQRTRLSNGSVKNAIRLLRVNGIIERNGAKRNGRWVALM